jgi:Tol biopolymer transport system component/uncharacterized RDD family membrane protein YckC
MSQLPEPPAPATEPAPPAPPVQEDLLGRRSVAALIDVALLTGVFLIFSLTVGEVSTEGGFSVALNGAWSPVYLGVVLWYYFVFEVAVGQSVGKRLLGLRVTRADGGRPSAAAISVRTLLRLVDWLPFLYLVGFVAMLATGVRRQRLGDLAAKTRVVRALPGGRRGLALVPVALVAVLLALSAYYASVTGNAAKTYQGHGVSFEYPAGWQQASEIHVTATAGGGEDLWRTAVAPGTDEVSQVRVEAYRIDTPVTAENLAEVKPEAATAVRQLLEQLGGAVQSGPEELTVGGLPALRFRGTATIEATPIEVTVVFVIDHTTQYTITCGHTPETAAEIQRGCDQILRTFTVTAPADATGAATASTRSDSRPGGEIAFTSNRSGTYNIYLVNADGSGLRQLTRFRAGNVARPSLSPDGNAVVFQHQDLPEGTWDVWVVGTDGSEPRNLTPEPDDEGAPTWSPDGTKIAFGSNRAGAFDLFLMNPDGSGIEQLTDGVAIEDDPAFSPDGKRLAYLEGSTADPPVWQLWTMNADGSGARRLTKTPVEYERPAWSADGTRIAFTRGHRDHLAVSVIDANGGRERRLTSGAADDYQPTWSPDGRRIAFGSNRAGPPSLFLMHADGSHVARLTQPDEGQDEDLSWQPAAG